MAGPIVTDLEARVARLEKAIEWLFHMFSWPRHPQHPDPIVDEDGNPTDPTPVEPPTPPPAPPPVTPPPAPEPPSTGAEAQPGTPETDADPANPDTSITAEAPTPPTGATETASTN